MTLIFDYDGTLHDTAAPYGVAVRRRPPGSRSRAARRSGS